jgi:hypothetical protein
MLSRAHVERIIAELTAAPTFQKRSRICRRMDARAMRQVLSVAERDGDVIATDVVREALSQRLTTPTAPRAVEDGLGPW